MKRLVNIIAAVIIGGLLAGCAENEVTEESRTVEIIIEAASETQTEESEPSAEIMETAAVSAETVAKTETEAETEAVTEKYPWKNAYAEILDKTVEDFNQGGLCFMYYWVYDIDKNMVPELIVETEHVESDTTLHFYTYDDAAGTAVYLHDYLRPNANLCGYEEGNGLICQTGKMEYETDWLITLEDNMLNIDPFFSGNISQFHPFESIEHEWLPTEEYSLLEWDGNIENQNKELVESILSEYIIPDSSFRELTKEDLEAMDDQTLRLALNEIYARNNRKFHSEDLNVYFGGLSWYRGYIEPEEFSDSYLSEIEQKNISLIDSMRNGNEPNDPAPDLSGIIPPSKVYTDQIGVRHYTDNWGNEDIEYSFNGETGDYLYLTSHSSVEDHGNYYVVPNVSITIIVGWDEGDSPIERVIAEDTTIYVKKNAAFSAGSGMTLTASQLMKQYGRLFIGNYSGLTMNSCIAEFDENGFLSIGTAHPFG